jgi:hypothetical protein
VLPKDAVLQGDLKIILLLIKTSPHNQKMVLNNRELVAHLGLCLAPKCESNVKKRRKVLNCLLAPPSSLTGTDNFHFDTAIRLQAGDQRFGSFGALAVTRLCDRLSAVDALGHDLVTGNTG